MSTLLPSLGRLSHLSRPGSRVVLKIVDTNQDLGPEKMTEELRKVMQIIKDEGVTTIVWDDDTPNHKLYSLFPEHAFRPPSQALTRLLVELYNKLPHLELIYFKRVNSIDELFPPHPNPYDCSTFPNMKPYDCLATVNTEMRKSHTVPIDQYPIRGNKYVIAMHNDLTSDELIDEGYQWIKTVARVDSIKTYIL